ncbi:MULTISPECIES: hypothetical protein [unclassified Rhizobium]|uniref:hypothetical protein n=1 Tax=unclassified Rhizobium TaxID=2613769 RepID=UPI001602DD7E|nr:MULTISPECIES: hypothetical protein [unclassified Rhizobium]MBB1249849.1 hypothetical protein [Rhizobium sp. G21]MCV3765769.1 hypothetical protein [Rhizobium sp. TRM95796]
MLRMFAVTAAIIAAGYVYLPAQEGAARIDPVTSASVARPDNKEFTVSNMENGAVCIVTRGKLLSSRSRQVQASADCEQVWPGLATARNWTDNGDGTVALTNDGGEAILTLGFGDGVEYESLEPENAVLALNGIG